MDRMISIYIQFFMWKSNNSHSGLRHFHIDLTNVSFKTAAFGLLKILLMQLVPGLQKFLLMLLVLQLLIRIYTLLYGVGDKENTLFTPLYREIDISPY